MKRLLKILLIILMGIGIMLSLLNAANTDTIAGADNSQVTGTVDAEGDCYGAPLNC